MIDLGEARAVVARPTGSPPTSRKVLWYEQTDVVNNPDKGVLRYFDWSSGSWELLKQESTFLYQKFTATANQTVFTLATAVAENMKTRTQGFIDGLKQIYGTAFTIDNENITMSEPLEAGEIVEFYWFK